jgi:adenylate kinase
MTPARWIVLLGPPGCGKGTQAEYLVSGYGFRAICVGDILRANSNKVIESLGDTVGNIIGKGALLPDLVIVDLVKDSLAVDDGRDVPREAFLLDGFPRTIGQAEALSLLVENAEILVLNFIVDDQMICKRILGRFRCLNCGKIYNDFYLAPEAEGICDVCGSTQFDRRSDDNEESLKKRLAEYHQKTRPLVDYYSKRGVLFDIDARLDFDGVKKSVLERLSLSKKESN